MTEKTMLRKGYEIKHSTVGWWVDGACGYAVAAYFDTRKDAVSEASKAIEEARRNIARNIWHKPVWYQE